MTNRIHRREFVKTATSGALGIGSIARGSAMESKIRMGLIGCGWYGMVDLKAAFKAGGIEAVAICDVDSQHLEQGISEIEKFQEFRPKTFRDYRELLETPGLEAVIIATPPQWHALPFIAACQKKLDIYCEKPLAYDIREGRAMVDAARASGRVIQVGFQRRQNATIQEAAEYIQEGKAGKIIQVDVQIHYEAKIPDTRIQAPPPSLEWDWWCGPAPMLPYSPSIGHIAWRLEAAYGNGHLVDWGIHWIDAIRVILGETTPLRIYAAGGIYSLKGKITTPDTLCAYFEFGQCPVVWRHRIWGAAEYDREVNNGVFFYGEKSTVVVTDGRWITIPRGENLERRIMEPSQSVDTGVRHMSNFLECIRSRRPPACPPLEAFQSTATVQLAMIALTTKSPVNWDAGKETIPDNAAAVKLLKREYRAPWSHPYTG